MRTSEGDDQAVGRRCSACGATVTTDGPTCPVCHERFVTAAEVERAARGPFHPYLVASFVVAGCGLFFGSVLGLVAVGFALAARRHDDPRWPLGLAAGIASIALGILLSLIVRGFLA